MSPTQFLWWLTGFMECLEQQADPLSENSTFKHIQEVLRSVTCWEIEQGDTNK